MPLLAKMNGKKYVITVQTTELKQIFIIFKTKEQKGNNQSR